MGTLFDLSFNSCFSIVGTEVMSSRMHWWHGFTKSFCQMFVLCVLILQAEGVNNVLISKWNLCTRQS